MNSSKLIGAILIIISLALAYVGFNKVADNSKEINLLGLKIEASDESAKNQGYLYIGLGILLFAGGVYTLNKSKN